MDKPLKPVTHGQCDVRPHGYLPMQPFDIRISACRTTATDRVSIPSLALTAEAFILLKRRHTDTQTTARLPPASATSKSTTLILHRRSPSSLNDTAVYSFSYGQRTWNHCRYILRHDLRHFGDGDPRKWGPRPCSSNSTETFCTMHTKFHHPMFNRSDVITLSSSQTNKQTRSI